MVSKKPTKSQLIQVRVYPSTKIIWNEYAKQKGVGLSEFVTQIVEDYVLKEMVKGNREKALNR